MRRTAAVALFLLTATLPAHAGSPSKVIDLSHAFDADAIYWPTETGFVLEPGPAGVTEQGFYYSANGFRAPEHGGTHIDAPIHFFEGRHTVDQIPVERLIGPGVVVDVREACAKDRDYRVRTRDLKQWEKQHGKIPDGAIVLLNTGFGSFWPDRVRYMGTDERGAEAVSKLHFPGLHEEAAAWLVEKRSIHAVGLDTPSIDHGPSTDFATHVRLFESNVPALENVANLDRLPASGFTVFALPMKIRGGSGGPTRIIAVFD